MLNEDYRDMLFALSEAGVRYLLVGAYALAAHGQVRATGDIDLWVQNSEENSVRVMEALRSFGAPLHEISEEDFRRPNTVFQIGVAPRRIDILTEIDGVRFSEAWKNRVEVVVSGISVPVIGRSDLIRNKLSTGRTKDLADAEWLQGEG